MVDGQNQGDRLERWKGSLLDLTMRNRLLNHKDSKTILPLCGGDLAQVQALLGERALVLRLRPDARGQSPDLDALAEQMLSRGDLLVDLPEAEGMRRMRELFREGQSLIQETGSCPLYLVFGMLRWFEAEKSQERLAPVLLQPVVLKRDSVRGPYRLERVDEPPMLNITLLKRLEHDFGLKVALPELEQDLIDVEQVLDHVQHGVSAEPGFEVRRQAVVGLYHFNKFLMWQDLESNTEQLLQSEVVQRLLLGIADEQKQSFVSADELDEVRPAVQDLSVVDADSSQLAAIFSALEGKSFVLQGPPGTGKSQTITNLIAQMLGQGKTVLFVAEKRAALEVVHGRLIKAGLGPFVLDAHSEKSTGRHVVRQLEEPFEFQWSRPSGEWERVTSELQAQRAELNRHVQRMHEPGPWGESLFQALSRLIGASETPDVDFALAFPDRDGHARLCHVVSELARRAAVAQPGESHWRGVSARWTPEWERRVFERLEVMQKVTSNLVTALDEAAVALLPGDPLSGNAALLEQLARLLVASPSPSPAILSGPWAELERMTEVLRERLDRGQARETSALAVFDSEIYRQSLPELRARFQRWASSWLAVFMLFFARRRLAPMVRGELPDNQTLLEGLVSAEEVLGVQQELGSDAETFRQIFAPYWQGLETDIRTIEGLVAWVRKFRVARAAAVEQWGHVVGERLSELACAPEELLGETRAGRCVAEVVRASEDFARERLAFRELLGADEGFLARQPEECMQQLMAWSADRAQLRTWCDWVESEAHARQLGLGELVDRLLERQLEPGLWLSIFEKGLRRRWIEAETDRREELRRFRGEDHNDLIARFRQTDNAARDVARQEIQARLAARLPDRTAPGEMAILQREFGKKRSFKALRKLYEEAPQVMLRLKPCVLMSPLSVARFLAPGLDLFDLVVFDEASQIPPWDAVGALARAKQAVVVGDSKQLPPTSFFVAEGGDPEDPDQVDMESVLDECIAAGLPQLRLNWHYRSRHESLIAFSNQQYYDNGLHIFPSPFQDGASVGVQLVPVPDGFYDRGGSKTNRAEAEAIVAAVVRRLRDPKLCEKTIGIVTFSQPQQRLVEDLMDEARRSHPEIERFFVDVLEPVFIKNLENVQGDERDVILFSVCYAANQAGHLTMNFGPLNKPGGERRLNVAVTRARELLMVFSTLRADQIDLGRTSAYGVRDLKVFLDYAARGQRALREMISLDSGRGFDSPFEKQVSEALERRGWRVQSQVGVGGYWIDLGVVHPEFPGAYVLGVECDGAAYHSSMNARDRDRIRQKVLEGLGWQIHRVWSTDWWHDPVGETDRIEMAIRKALLNFGAPRAAMERSIPAEIPLPERTDEVTREPEWPSGATRWVEPVIEPGDVDFYSVRSRERIARQAADMVTQVGPLGLDYIARRVVDAWGVSLTKKARKHVEDVVGRAFPGQVADEVLWLCERPVRGFRYADRGERDFNHVLGWELENALVWVVERSIGAGYEEIYREVARVFGSGRVSAGMIERLDRVMRKIVES